jgi:hypothetical protein
VVSADVISKSLGDALEKFEITTVPTSAQIENRVEVLCSSQKCFKVLVKKIEEPTCSTACGLVPTSPPVTR